MMLHCLPRRIPRRSCSRYRGALLLVLLLPLLLVMPAAADSPLATDDLASSSSVAVAAVIVVLGTVPVWVTGITYGTIGIFVAGDWPNPGCCCFRGPFASGRGFCCDSCLPLLPACVTILVFQIILWLLHIIFFALIAEEDAANIVFPALAQILDLTSIGLLGAAALTLHRVYKKHGPPQAQHDVVIGAPVVVVPGIVQMAPPMITYDPYAHQQQRRLQQQQQQQQQQQWMSQGDEGCDSHHQQHQQQESFPGAASVSPPGTAEQVCAAMTGHQ